MHTVVLMYFSGLMKNSRVMTPVGFPHSAIQFLFS